MVILTASGAVRHKHAKVRQLPALDIETCSLKHIRLLVRIVK